MDANGFWLNACAGASAHGGLRVEEEGEKGEKGEKGEARNGRAVISSVRRAVCWRRCTSARQTTTARRTRLSALRVDARTSVVRSLVVVQVQM